MKVIATKIWMVLLCIVFAGFNSTFAQEVEANFAISLSGASNQHGNGIVEDIMGNSFVTGHFYAEIVLGDSLFTSLGNQDAFLAKLDPQGEILWALSFGGNGADEGLAVAVDAEGNCYATGFIGSLDVEIQDQTISSLGGYDVYVLKFSPSGDLLWANTFGSSTNDMGRAIAISQEGMVQLGGSFQAMMTMGTEVLVSTSSIDAFAAQMDAQGNVIWARSINGPNQVEARGIAVDSSGNTYVAGDFLGDSVSAGDLSEPGFGSYDAFLVKYDSEGEVLSLRAMGAEGADSGVALSTDVDGNLFLAGYFEGSFDVDGVSLSSNGSKDMMLIKFNESGLALWAKSVGSTGNDIAYGVDTDAEGNCFLTGLFYSTVSLDDFVLSGGGTLAAKLNAQAEYEWALAFADANVDNGGRGIAVNENGEAWIIGNFFSPFVLGGIEVGSSVGRDVFVVLIEDVTYLGIDHLDSNRGLKLFPNPASDFVHLQGLTPNTRCDLLDMQGQLVYRYFCNDVQMTIELPSLPTGMYFLRTEHKGEFKLTKLQLID